jgi:hypothetical protein
LRLECARILKEFAIDTGFVVRWLDISLGFSQRNISIQHQQRQLPLPLVGEDTAGEAEDDDEEVFE